MTALDLADASVGGVLAWYSTVHTPPELLPRVFGEFHRVLRPGGQLLLAFKAGDRHIHRDQAYGHDLSLDIYWVPPERVAELLTEAGFVVDVRMVREPDQGEKGPQGFFTARRPVE